VNDASSPPGDPSPPARDRRRYALIAIAVLAAIAAVTVLVASPWSDDDPTASSATTTTAPTSTTAEMPVQGEPGAPGVGDPYYPGLGNGGFDAEHYTLDLTWLADEGVLEGVATMDATATQDLSRLNLDLSGLEVRSVTVAGEEAEWTRDGRELVIDPATDIAEGAELTTVITYAGTPEPIIEGTDLFQLGWQTDGREVFVVSEPSGAQTFFPVSDHPTDKATYTIRVTAPEDQTVAANGLLVGENDTGHGTRSWTYEASDPMASYLVQIAIGDYQLVDAGKVGDVTVRHAFHRSVADDAAVTAEKTAEMIGLLDDIYGPYPFEAYGVLAVPQDLGFALETQTLTIIGSDIAGEGRDADQVLLHELAHQWVGNAVSPSTWQHIWLNEGFATYAEWLWLERTGKISAADSARQLEGEPQLDSPPGDPGADELFGAPVYLRGGMTLQALRERIGDESFFALLPRWVDEHRGSTASTDDLIALAEEISGQQLDDLFDAWLYAPEMPSL
jgi:aminopeptidase N